MKSTKPNWVNHATPEELKTYADLEGVASSANAQRERIRRLCMIRARKASKCAASKTTSTD